MLAYLNDLIANPWMWAFVGVALVLNFCVECCAVVADKIKRRWMPH